MSKTNVGANLMFALRTKTIIKPMFENEIETFAFGHRIANDYCSEGEQKVRPYIDIGSELSNTQSFNEGNEIKVIFAMTANDSC